MRDDFYFQTLRTIYCCQAAAGAAQGWLSGCFRALCFLSIQDRTAFPQFQMRVLNSETSNVQSQQAVRLFRQDDVDVESGPL